MGFSVAYLAVPKKDKSLEIVLKELRLIQLDENPKHMIVAKRNEITGGYFGDYVMITSGDWNLIEDKSNIKNISKGTIVLTGFVHEGGNFCSASQWKDGKQTWEVVHELDKAPNHLEIKGNPPDILDSIKDRIKAELLATPVKERWDHFFQIPVDLFKSFVGFEYCMDPSPDQAEISEWHLLKLIDKK